MLSHEFNVVRLEQNSSLVMDVNVSYQLKGVCMYYGPSSCIAEI